MIAKLDSWQQVALGCSGAMFITMGLGRFSYSTMVPALVLSGQMSAEQAGWVGGANLTGFFLGAFMSETLRRRWNSDRILRAVVVLSLIALVASAAPWGAVWLGFWRALLGTAAGLSMVLGLALTTAAAPETRQPAAAGLMFAGVGVAIFFSGVLVPWLLDLSLAWAWGGVAAVGLAGAGLAFSGLRAAVGLMPNQDMPALGILPVLRQDRALLGLAVAHFLFSFGITPHTLYWVDFLVRDFGLGIDAGGAHWAAVGAFAILGPWAAVWLARRLGTAWAVVIAFVVLGVGVALPAWVSWLPGLWLSTMIFGAQPGVSTLQAARVRDLGRVEAMPGILRVMIISSALGGAVGGLVFPAVFSAITSYGPMFIVAAVGLIIGALSVLPRTDEVK